MPTTEVISIERPSAESLKSTKDAITQIKDQRPALIVVDVGIDSEQSGPLLLDLITLDP